MTHPPIRVLVTRSHAQNSALSDRLKEAGMAPVEAPLIHIEDPDDWGPLDRAIARLDTYDWIIFTSGRAVEKFFARLSRRGRRDGGTGKARVAVVGSATEKRLRAYGVTPAYRPARFDAEALVAGLAQAYPVQGARVLFPCADIARATVAAGLTACGAHVTRVTAYRTVPSTTLPPQAAAMLERRQVRVVTFASPSTVRAFVEAVGASRLRDLLSGVIVACMGPVTARAATEAGRAADVVPAEASVPALVDAIVKAVAR